MFKNWIPSWLFYLSRYISLSLLLANLTKLELANGATYIGITSLAYQKHQSAQYWQLIKIKCSYAMLKQNTQIGFRSHITWNSRSEHFITYSIALLRNSKICWWHSMRNMKIWFVENLNDRERIVGLRDVEDPTNLFCLRVQASTTEKLVEKNCKERVRVMEKRVGK